MRYKYNICTIRLFHIYLFYIGYQFNLLMNDDLSLREADVQTGAKMMIIEETGKPIGLNY